jgi:hypothetical protein
METCSGQPRKSRVTRSPLTISCDPPNFLWMNLSARNDSGPNRLFGNVSLELFAALLLLGLAGCALPKAPVSLPDVAHQETAQSPGPAFTRVRVEVWNCCLCGGPDHGNSYEALESKRATNMLFEGEFVISAIEQNSRLSEFLARNLPEDKKYLTLHIYKAIAYHLVSDAHTYEKYRNTRVGKFTMGTLQPGDLLVCYPEAY